ncbi:hypothetical protein VKT23_014931 [Stygiomarasmius scandens]|uniref:Uncharacterized protein n=1 Tax=Marasmiellus scandens TaxID=2682957 RepID=A0ABR1IZ25_9AGAR
MPVLSKFFNDVFPLPTQDILIRYLTPKTRRSLATASREANIAVSSYNDRAYRLDKAYSRFLKSAAEINKFRILQYQFGVLVSGSVALQYMDCSEFLESDLDVYVCSHSAKHVEDFFKSIGYTCSPNRPFPVPVGDADPNFYRNTGISKVLNYERDGQKVQIVATVWSPIDVILGFHSTVVMNFLTFSHAYSLKSRNSKAALEKYEDRGWSRVFVPSFDDFLQPSSEVYHGERCVGDTATWVRKLEPLQFDSTLGNIPANVMDFNMDPVRANSWYQRICGNQFVFDYVNDRGDHFKQYYTAKYIGDIMDLSFQDSELDTTDPYRYENRFADIVHSIHGKRRVPVPDDWYCGLFHHFRPPTSSPRVPYGFLPTASAFILCNKAIQVMNSMLGGYVSYTLDWETEPVPERPECECIVTKLVFHFEKRGPITRGHINNFLLQTQSKFRLTNVIVIVDSL